MVRRLGLVPYEEAIELQQEVVEQRQRDEIPDTVLLLRHPPIITVGSRGDLKDVLMPGDIPVVETKRGGQVTYHGPDQLVAWAIMRVTDLHKHLRFLEQVVIDVLQNYGLKGERVEGRTGVWVGGNKICAIGVRASRWVTSHGLALNVGPDLSAFERIVPCGITDAGVTSLNQELGHTPPDPEARFEAILLSTVDC